MSRATELISARRRDLPRLVPLLCLLLLGGTVAAPSPETLYRQAMAVAEKGDTKTVLAITHDALTRFRDSDNEWVWRIRCLRSRALVNDGKSDEAIALLQRPFPPSLRRTAIDLKRLESLAWAVAKSKNPEPAESLIAQAYTLAKEKYPNEVAPLLVIRMIIDRRNAMKWGTEALGFLRKYPNATAELSVRGQIALHYALSARFDESIDMAEPVLAKARNGGNEAYLEKLEGNLGWAYMELGDYERASELLESAYPRALRIGQRIDAVPWTYQLGNVRLQKGDLAGAEKYYRAAYELAREINHEQLSGILGLLASYELRVGRLAEAQRDADEALRTAKARERTDDELQALLISGRIAAAEGKYARGETLLNDVVARTKAKSSIKSEALARLAQLNANRGNFSAADEQFRQSIAVARQVREDIGSMELRFSFFNAMEELFDSYVDFLMARGRAAEALAVTESSRAQTLEEASDLAEPGDVRVMARDTGATILCYWLGKAQSYLWIVTPEKIDYVKLPPKGTIETEINAYQNDLSGPRGTLSGSGARGEALWRMLVEPASRAIAPGSRVIVVPHGRLNAFNMETLVVPAKRYYWINDVIITTAGSLRLLVQKDSKKKAVPRLLLVGNAPSPSPEFPPLPKAREELDKIARHFDRKQWVELSGAKATPSAYRAALPERFTFLHFVAHAVPTRRKPLDSAVVLAREGETFKLYARDIARQPLTATLVTISSCHGAGTRTYAGEGLVGLGWAFLRAGADNVVAALWEVSDEATPTLMDSFYGSLAKEADPATALRNAKLVLIRRGGIHARPLYWAPFVLYGSS